MTTYQAADKSIVAYDAYVFASVGRSFSSDRADSLAAVAAVDCEVASRDRKVNQVTRTYYAVRAAEFYSIVA